MRVMSLATLQQVESFRTEQNIIVALAREEVRTFWEGLDKSNPEFVRTELIAFMQDLNEQYGSVASGAAADWFDEIREVSNVPGVFRALAAEPVPSAQVAGSTGWALSRPDTFGALWGISDRLIKQAGRNTIHDAINRDPNRSARYVRVPSGSSTCAFCLMLASRAHRVFEDGGGYGSRGNAGFRNSPRSRNAGKDYGDRYHDDCDCVVTPVYSVKDFPSGFDPESLYSTYEKGVAEAGSGNVKQILSGIRTVSGHGH